jgi:hypothetical protein
VPKVFRAFPEVAPVFHVHFAKNRIQIGQKMTEKFVILPMASVFSSGTFAIDYILLM